MLASNDYHGNSNVLDRLNSQSKSSEGHLKYPQSTNLAGRINNTICLLKDNILITDFKLIDNYDYSQTDLKTFFPPSDIQNTEIPQSLQILDKIQTTFSKYNSQNQKDTIFLLDFIESNYNLGLREFEINIFIRPRNVKSYAFLFSKFSKHLKQFALKTLHITKEFYNFLVDYKYASVYEAKQMLTFTSGRTFSYVEEISSLIYFGTGKYMFDITKEIVDAAIEDDVDFFVSLSSNQNFNFNQYYNFNRYVVTLQQLLCLYGAIESFKYFLLNNCNLNNLSYFAIAGGNNEIIRILIQKNVNFKGMEYLPLLFRYDEVYDWITSNCMEKMENSDLFLLSETMSIKAICSLSQNNVLINTNDLLSAATADGLMEICREMSKFSLFSTDLFMMTTDEECINNMINNMDKVILTKAINACIDNQVFDHLEIMAKNENFYKISLSNDDIMKIRYNAPKVYNIIMEHDNNLNEFEEILNHFNNQFPLSSEKIMILINTYLSIRDFKSVEYILSNTRSLNRSDLMDILRRYPFFFNKIFIKILNNEINEEELIDLVRYYYHPNDKSPVIPINKFGKIPDSLTVFDCINLLSMNFTSKSINWEILNFLISRNYIKCIVHSQENKQYVNEIIQTEEFKKEFTNSKISLINVLPQFENLISLYNKDDVEIDQEIFDKLLDLYIYTQDNDTKDSNFPRILLNTLLSEKNRKFINIKELATSKFNFPFIVNVELNRDEFNFLRDELMIPTDNLKLSFELLMENADNEEEDYDREDLIIDV